MKQFIGFSILLLVVGCGAGSGEETRGTEHTNPFSVSAEISESDFASQAGTTSIPLSVPTNTSQSMICNDPHFGDVNGDGLIDVDDVNCIREGFANPATCPGADIAPCGGDGYIDLDDMLAVLEAYEENTAGTGGDDEPLRPHLIGYVKGLPGTIQGVALSPDHQTLMIGSREVGILAYDVTDPSAPRLIRQSKIFHNTEQLAFNDNVIIIGGPNNYVRVADRSTFGTPSESWTQINLVAQRFWLSGNLLTIAAGFSGLAIFDVTDPSSPQTLANLAIPNARAVVLSANRRYAYVASAQGSNGGLKIIDLLNPVAPREVGHLPALAGGNATDLTLDPTGHYIYLAEYGAGLTVIDVTIPNTPRRLGSFFSANGPFWRITMAGEWVVALTGLNQLATRIYDLSNPQMPVEVATALGSLDVTGDVDTLYALRESKVEIYGLATFPLQLRFTINGGVENRVASAAQGHIVLTGGPQTLVEVADVSDPFQPMKVASIPKVANDIVYVGNTAYLATGASGLQLVNMSDPSLPQLGARIPLTALGIAVSPDGHFAYVASLGSGIKVIDLFESPPAIKESATIDTPGSARDVAINGDGTLLFVADFGSGLQVIDIRNPLQGRIIGAYLKPNDGPAERVHLVNEIALVSWGLTSPHTKLIDVANPFQPKWLASLLAYGQATSMNDLIAIPAGSSGLMIVDLAQWDFSNPSPPANAQFLVPLPGVTQSASRAGSRFYASDVATVVDVIDLVASP